MERSGPRRGPVRRALAYRNDALAVISLDAIAGVDSPRLLITGDTARSPAAALVRTAAVRVLEQSGREPEHASGLRQLLDLAFPFTFGEQGPFVARGIPAVTLTTVPDKPSQGFEDDPLDAARLGELGRATQNLVGSLDAGLELAQGTTSYVYLGSAIRAGLDDRARPPDRPPAVPDRDDRPLRPLPAAACPARPAARSLRSRLFFWGYAGVLLFVATKLGAFPAGEPRPLPPTAASTSRRPWSSAWSDCCCSAVG